jgi:hypothetical protein
MGWTEPQYSRSHVTRAGREYVDPAAPLEDREIARDVINNWRSSHSYPLNTMQIYLRTVAGRFDNDPTVAQRIKRLPSIRHKIERYPKMKLAGMQDIGGCRAVVASVDGVEQIVDYYLKKSRIKHVRVRHDAYIEQPPPSGYRGHHLVYAYDHDKHPQWNGLKIEIQVRTRLQHAWATAVETAGTFTHQALKSSQGAADWLRFFALMSSALALREGTALVPGTPTDSSELATELRDFAEKLNVVARLQGFQAAVTVAKKGMGGARMFLLELETAPVELDLSQLTIRGYDDAQHAADAYGAIERAIENDPTKDVVMVTADSVTALERAYPNYFADTKSFVESLREATA